MGTAQTNKSQNTQVHGNHRTAQQPIADDTALVDLINELDQDINRTETEAERLLRVIREAPAKIDAAAKVRDEAFGRPDEAEVVEKARQDGQAAHQAREEAVARLKTIAVDVQDLKDRRERIRQTVAAELTESAAERDRILRRLSEVQVRSNQVDAIGEKIARLGALLDRRPA